MIACHREPPLTCLSSTRWVESQEVGLIAQLAERVADNDEVPGSSPGGPILFKD